MFPNSVPRPVLAVAAAGVPAQPALAREPAPQGAILPPMVVTAPRVPRKPTHPSNADAAGASPSDRAIAAATAACDTGDPAVGALEATRIARLAGRFEARAGSADPIWPDRLASH